MPASPYRAGNAIIEPIREEALRRQSRGFLPYRRQGDSKSLQPDKRTTAGERHEENSEIKRGIYPREDSRT